MLTVVKPVYYCEHCKMHRLTTHAVLSHEVRCIYNPRRSVCGWHKNMAPSAPADFALVFRDDPNVEWLRKQMDGCPACMLAVVVQARKLGLSGEEAWEFDYKAECATFRESERYVDVW